MRDDAGARHAQGGRTANMIPMEVRVDDVRDGKLAAQRAEVVQGAPCRLHAFPAIDDDDAGPGQDVNDVTERISARQEDVLRQTRQALCLLGHAVRVLESDTAAFMRFVDRSLFLNDVQHDLA